MKKFVLIVLTFGFFFGCKNEKNGQKSDVSVNTNNTSVNIDGKNISISNSEGDVDIKIDENNVSVTIDGKKIN